MSGSKPLVAELILSAISAKFSSSSSWSRLLSSLNFLATISAFSLPNNVANVSGLESNSGVNGLPALL